jgi:hypothetical protein
LGSLKCGEKFGEYEIVDLGVDAQINLARGVVVTNTTAPVTPMLGRYLFLIIVFYV